MDSRRDTGNKKTIFIIVLLVILIAGLGFVLTGIHSSSGDPDAATQATVQTQATEGTQASDGPQATDPADAEAEPASPDATLFFVSDYQKQRNWPSPRESFTGFLQAAGGDGKIPDQLTVLGDYTNDRKLHDYQLSPEDSIKEIRETADESFPDLAAAADGTDKDNSPMLFVQGNHDRLTESIAASGLHEFDDYLIYIVNTQNDFPWKQGKESGTLKKVRHTAKDMKTCFDQLIASGETRPVFIAAHVPLHFSARTSSAHANGDNLYSSLLFNVINEAGKSLDIVYLYGHNHSKGWDCYMGGSCVYKAVGDTLLLPAFAKTDIWTNTFTEETLNFTYLNAGYTGYYMNCGPEEIDNGTTDRYHAADETLTGTVIEVFPQRLVLTRYDADGVHSLGSEGEADPYKGGVDKGLIDPKYYSHETSSPQEVERHRGVH